MILLRALIFLVLLTGQSFATINDATGFEADANDSTIVEDWTVTGTGFTFNSTAPKNGRRNLRLNTSGETRICKNFDSALTSTALQCVWIKPTAATLSSGTKSVIMTFEQDSETGCYAQLEYAGQYSLYSKYQGKFSQAVTFAGGVLNQDQWNFVCLGEKVTTSSSPDGIECPLWINGEPKVLFSQSMTGDVCSACDLAEVCLGTSSGSCSITDKICRVDGDCPGSETCVNASTTVTNLDFDDWILKDTFSTSVVPDFFHALLMTPISQSSSPPTSEFSTNGTATSCVTGDTNAWKCLDDWCDPVNNPGTCTTTTVDPADNCFLAGSTASTRSRDATGVRTDLYEFSNPTVPAGGSIKFIKTVALGCNDSSDSTSASVSITWRSTDVNEVNSANATWNDSSSALYFISELRVKDTASPGTTDWTSSSVNALDLGYSKQGGTSGEPRFTSMLAYAGIEVLAPEIDQNLQDWNGDSVVTLVGGWHSIITGTGNSTCISGTCSSACVTDADCTAVTAGVCNPSTLKCEYPCTTSTECGGCSGICAADYSMMNQFAAAAPQIDNVISCTRSQGLPSFADYFLRNIAFNSNASEGMAFHDFCQKVKGQWGHCSNSATTNCTGNGDCSGGGTCIRHLPDYVLNMDGGSPLIIPTGFGDNCRGNGFFAGNYQCPLPYDSPSGFQCQLTACSADADCYPDGGGGSYGKCMAAVAEGHSNPYWPCNNDIGTCGEDSSRSCINFKRCSLSPSQGCAVNTDCNLNGWGSCIDWKDSTASNSTNFFWPPGYWQHGLCETCTWNNCDTAGQNYCSCPGDGVSCSVDSTCQPGGNWMGGYCNGGTCKGVNLGYSIPSTAAQKKLVNKRLMSAKPSTGDYRPILFSNPKGIYEQIKSTRDYVETQNARLVFSSEPMSLEIDDTLMYIGYDRNKALRDLFLNELYFVDSRHPFRWRENRGAAPVKADWGSTTRDGVHENAPGSILSGIVLGAYFNNLYPVCSGDLSTLCGYCDVSCSVANDCDPDTIGSGNVGLCNGSGKCYCTNDTHCPTGTTCKEVFAGQDKKCVTDDIEKCPLGLSTARRYRPYSDRVCSLAGQGTCSKEIRLPGCTTYPENKCTTTANCQGRERGDICAPDAIWQSCANSGQCRTDGGFTAAVPFCVPGSFTTGDEQNKACEEVIQTPTPTPTNTATPTVTPT